MSREHRLDPLVPAGPRPAAQSPTRSSKENINPGYTTAAFAAHDGPMLHASSSNNHSLFSFGRNGAPSDVDDSSTTSFDFLPSVSFDDLQSSLESASTGFKLTQFPSPSGQGSILSDVSCSDDTMAGQQYHGPPAGGDGRATKQPSVPSNAGTTRSSRSGSILRRPSISGRQVSSGSVMSISSSIVDAPTAPAASARNRRQSHYPPVSSSNIAKPPRKSVGSGIIDADYASKSGVKRRPSLLTSGRTERHASEGPQSSAESVGGESSDNARQLDVSRATKARSIQPAPRLSTTFSTASGSNGGLNPEKSRISTSFSKSPRAKGTAGTSRRVSVMPTTHSSHASGLGARTISPTDAQRMKRMSAYPHSLASIATAPPPPIDLRPNSRSPSMIPRKAPTPSSSRTTPEVTNRKSYSSGLSVGSTTSHNTHRTSTSSIQRLSQPGPSTRLPAPKGLGLHNPPPTDDEEDVPPVPAIPKAYESPKDSPAELSWLEKRKSNYGLDSSSIHSNSTETLSNPSVLEPPVKIQANTTQRKLGPRKSLAGVSDAEQKAVSNPSKRHLQPLSLPPLNLGPLSTPTAAKIAALQEQGSEKGKLTPPPMRALAKTPTTPMTASRSTFFARGRVGKAADIPIPRSSSTVHHSRLESPSAEDTNSSSESLLDSSVKTPSRKPAVSPFLSSSAPKGGDTFENLITKSKTFGDLKHSASVERTTEFKPDHKPGGPRAPKVTKPKSPPPQTSPEEPPTPSSISSLRRKLSLSWKRSTSKSGNHASAGSMDKIAERQVRQDSMPPPRIPVSASMHLNAAKAPSPSHTAKPVGGYLESKRRKSSASSLNHTLTQDKTRTDGWHIMKKDTGNSSMIEASTQRAPLIQKSVRPRPSVASIKHNEPYTAEMDRDDHIAEEEMKKMGARKKETEIAARTLDALRKRATPKERVGPQDAIRIAILNIYEKGEIIDYSDIYFCGTQNANKIVGDLHTSKPNFGYDDERGDYSIIMGDHLAYRYEIVDVLGKGSFGQVVRCIDHKTGGLVAVKIIRNKKRFHQQALVEVNILKKLREWDPKNRHSMVNFTHSFYFRGHLCISTELLDMNLYEFIKSNSFRGFSLKLIRRFTKQMLSSLVILKQHKVIHCDLKPENILLRHPLHSEIKVIDFGSSCFENEKVYTYIQSRFYRSPEVILGMTYGLPIDMWSLGCILAELYTGVPIFPGENEQEQLACIMEVFGPPEKHLIEKSTRKKLFFDSMGKPRLTVSTKGRRRRPSSKTLQQAIKCDDEPFLDFLGRCLRWDPDRRLKPEEAIRHEYITGYKATVTVSRARESSPMKRHNTQSAPRPLPEPPVVTKSSNTVFRPRELSNSSPHKSAPGGPRRVSGINGATTTSSVGVKRTSTGSGPVPSSAIGNSNLPRVAGRTASGKQDLASVGANVAMSRRA
ncbi:putative CMGC DYRK DYRK2 protein kinase [Rosellinia necatrix]|uniref:Putative CMGC DYRK DYRK2 protein kinase n=1 Tax=Rosellinia necatrix TaxID=77044 RepID=A0A1S7ULG1_ROSNE|nr:putative CMGC DYRK DYRK2 protein kinase [Rosellinia necatrix]